uniref:Uncharacterized protein n=1 Tax=Arundo donax TaxID=35708 RepID=A0A0A9G1J1_ARUDO
MYLKLNHSQLPQLHSESCNHHHPNKLLLLHQYSTTGRKVCCYPLAHTNHRHHWLKSIHLH